MKQKSNLASPLALTYFGNLAHRFQLYSEKMLLSDFSFSVHACVCFWGEKGKTSS